VLTRPQLNSPLTDTASCTDDGLKGCEFLIPLV
jgi:hypothetical protein